MMRNGVFIFLFFASFLSACGQTAPEEAIDPQLTEEGMPAEASPIIEDYDIVGTIKEITGEGSDVLGVLLDLSKTVQEGEHEMYVGFSEDADILTEEGKPVDDETLTVGMELKATLGPTCTDEIPRSCRAKTVVIKQLNQE